MGKNSLPPKSFWNGGKLICAKYANIKREKKKSGCYHDS